MKFIEVNAKPFGQDNIDKYTPIILNLDIIQCIAPYKNDTDRSVFKCGEKTAYIIDKPFDEISNLLKEEIIKSNSNKSYNDDWSWI